MFLSDILKDLNLQYKGKAETKLRNFCFLADF